MTSMPRIFIVSNEFCSCNSSNGRTLMNMLKGFSPDNLAQFGIRGEVDKGFCNNVFHVSDKDALNTFLFKKPKKNNKITTKKNKSNEMKKPERSCKNLVFRNLVWKSYRWWTKDFDDFIKRFNPNIIMFQAGDAPFMFNIVRRISKKYDVPIVMYNSENYVLKERMYSCVKKGDFWHAILRASLKKEYRKIMKVVSHCIYNTEYLEECYQKVYSHKGKSTVLYTATDMQDCATQQEVKPFNLLYCGNLGVGRVFSLNEIAKTLCDINKDYSLTICGKFINEEEKNLLLINSNVNYLGTIPYSEVTNKIAESTMVIHAENPDRLEDLKAAFSTKLADCLACGKPFLVFASREYPFVKYLEKNNVAHIAENVDELKNVLEKCVQDVEYRNKFLQNAKMLAEKNHGVKENCKKVKEIIKKNQKNSNE